MNYQVGQAEVIADVIRVFFNIIEILIFARIILSFFRPNPFNPVVRLLYDLTEPLLAPFRRLLPPVGMIDFSPILLFFVLGLVERLLVDLILR